MERINVAPSWGEWGNIYHRLVLSGQTQAIPALHPDFARAMAMAEAFKIVFDTLSDAQRALADVAFNGEMKKQGIDPE